MIISIIMISESVRVIIPMMMMMMMMMMDGRILRMMNNYADHEDLYPRLAATNRMM